MEEITFLKKVLLCNRLCKFVECQDHCNGFGIYNLTKLIYISQSLFLLCFHLRVAHRDIMARFGGQRDQQLSPFLLWSAHLSAHTCAHTSCVFADSLLTWSPSGPGITPSYLDPLLVSLPTGLGVCLVLW